jgi:endonuclease/exonuclease/phosphatase (EEP) superfamily protein YafD
MASSVHLQGRDIGVVTAARAPTVAHCTQRVTEPLIRLPKSSVVTVAAAARVAQAPCGRQHPFDQLRADARVVRGAVRGVVEALSQHDGPIILAGDLNTWTDERVAALQNVGQKLGLTEIPFESGRSRFLGHELDHILVRGLTVESAAAIAVKSSDHNPVTAVLRLTPAQ